MQLILPPIMGGFLFRTTKPPECYFCRPKICHVGTILHCGKTFVQHNPQLSKRMKKNKLKEEESATQDKEINVAEKEAPKSEESTTKETTQEEAIQALKDELTSAKDQNLRLYAEFENYKRRNAKERLELMSSANQEVMLAMLPILDDFERALKNIEKSDENKPLFEGVELIYNKTLETLKQKGLKPMDSSIGKDFDVEEMEAITRLPVPDNKQHNKVIDEVEKGYFLGPKVLRYARVVVAQHEG